MRTATTGSGTTLDYQSADPQGTATTDITADTLTVTHREYTPFGEDRGTAPTNWPGDKGFVGGTVDDTTGLTNLGAREYNPSLGRFISPDPLLDTDDPQQWNGYAYSNNDPVNANDPSGQMFNEGRAPESSCRRDCGSDSSPHNKSPKGKSGKSGSSSKPSAVSPNFTVDTSDSDARVMRKLYRAARPQVSHLCDQATSVDICESNPALDYEAEVHTWVRVCSQHENLCGADFTSEVKSLDKALVAEDSAVDGGWQCQLGIKCHYEKILDKASQILGSGGDPIRSMHGKLAASDDGRSDSDDQDVVDNADKVYWEEKADGSLAKVYLQRGAGNGVQVVIRTMEGGPITSFKSNASQVAGKLRSERGYDINDDEPWEEWARFIGDE